MEFNDGALKYRGNSFFRVGLSQSVDDFEGLHKLYNVYDFWFLGLLELFQA